VPLSTDAADSPGIGAPGERRATSNDVASRAARRGRRLLRRLTTPRGPRAMRRPDGTAHHAALAVADVDLTAGTATLAPTVHPYACPPEGVHALVWLHGEPVGQLTLPGDPEVLLPTLPALAARQLARPVHEHLLRDALATPGAVRATTVAELGSVPHPAPPVRDGSQVTVAVCTRDRPDDLRRCLEAIGRLDPAPAQVLVVDNGSRDDRTRRVAADQGVRYVLEPRPGLDWARNRALREAGTRIVAFTDDDVLVHPGWVGGLVRAFAEEPDAVAVTGLVAPAELSSPAQVLFEALGGFGRGFVRKWMSVTVDAGEIAAQLYPGTGGAGTGANMALLREPALALGGFDTALDVGTVTGGGGDLEMYFRVLASGGLLVYEPTAVVRHVHRYTLPELDRQMHGNGVGSYSIFAGAGLHYDQPQARAFTAFAIRWAATHHVRSHLRGLLWPRMWPRSLARAETRGMVEAVLHRRYDQARAQAAERAARFPGEPASPTLVRPAVRERPERQADPVVRVDLLRDGLAGDAVALPPTATSAARRLRLLVDRGGRPQAAITVPVRGARPSAARLRHEVVAWLGPAVLRPGAEWAEVLPPALPAAPATSTGPWQEPDAASVRGLTVSVLMATRDRPEALRRCIQQLLTATAGRDVQVVVVDNSPDPSGTRRSLAGLPGTTVLHEPRPGLSRARNAGLPALTGDVVVFVDDDITVTEGWLDALLLPFGDPEVSAVTGNVLPADLESLDPQIFEDYGGLGRGANRMVFRPTWLDRSRGPAPTWQIGATANAAVRREVLERSGPFDEVLGAGRPSGVGEDTEYFYRVLRGGGTIVYQPTAVVLHHHRGDRAALRRQLAAYSAGHVGYHLEIAARHHDLRGLVRVLVTLPRRQAGRWWAARRGLDDYPMDLLAAEVRGTLAGFPAWVRSRAGR